MFRLGRFMLGVPSPISIISCPAIGLVALIPRTGYILGRNPTPRMRVISPAHSAWAPRLLMGVLQALAHTWGVKTLTSIIGCLVIGLNRSSLKIESISPRKLRLNQRVIDRVVFVSHKGNSCMCLHYAVRYLNAA